MYLFIKRGQGTRERTRRRITATIIVHGNDAFVASRGGNISEPDGLDWLAVHIAIDLDGAQMAEVSTADTNEREDGKGQPQEDRLLDRQHD